MILPQESPESWTVCYYKGVKFPGYEISSYGRVRRATDSTNRLAGDILSPKKHSGGYLCLILCQAGVKTRTYIHRLLMYSFSPVLFADSLHINHKDGNKTNNRLNNLEWVTQAENNAHAIATGLSTPHNKLTKLRGADHPEAKLTEQEVIEIKSLLSNGEQGLKIAAQYNISDSLVSAIKLKRAWAHLP